MVPPTGLGRPAQSTSYTIFRVWVFVFAVVGAQMSWVLRPFIGSPDLEFSWFLAAKRAVLLNIAILCLMVVCGLGYGAVMGSYAESISAIRPRQALYSATKVPFLLLATFALSLPSFYVANTMLGLHADFGRALRWVLRPFIGSPNLGTAYFREEAWGNAYLEIFDLFYRLFFVG